MRWRGREVFSREGLRWTFLGKTNKSEETNKQKKKTELDNVLRMSLATLKFNPIRPFKAMVNV